MRYLNDTQRVWNTYLETTLFSNLYMAARKLLYTGKGMVLRYDMKKCDDLIHLIQNSVANTPSK